MRRPHVCSWSLAGWMAVATGCAGEVPLDPVTAMAQRNAMVTDQLEARGVRDPAVLAALRAVPRHAFVPEAQVPMAYADTPLPIGHGQTISQPYIVGLMTELASVGPEDRVLEIGTGSGYQAAVLAELTSDVYTIEIVDALAEEAADRLARLGYDAVRVRSGDGYLGWPEAAPFQAIVVTAGAPYLPQPLVDQLAPGGVMVIPVGPIGGVQHLRVVTKGADGAIDERNVLPVRFVPFTRKPAP